MLCKGSEQQIHHAVQLISALMDSDCRVVWEHRSTNMESTMTDRTAVFVAAGYLALHTDRSSMPCTMRLEWRRKLTSMQVLRLFGNVLQNEVVHCNVAALVGKCPNMPGF